ncbi:MAG TPA: hypothetical protein VG268_16770 [Streptosporangiaceae bacterium]|jgi:hypothetical protein|nr:hypothetical protein [Streptosporangiaceae bacterium]
MTTVAPVKLRARNNAGSISGLRARAQCSLLRHDPVRPDELDVVHRRH